MYLHKVFAYLHPASVFTAISFNATGSLFDSAPLGKTSGVLLTWLMTFNKPTQAEVILVHIGIIKSITKHTTSMAASKRDYNDKTTFLSQLI